MKNIIVVKKKAYYQKFFKRHQSESDLITGILLIYRGSFVHVLEASQSIVYSFIRDIGARKTFAPKTDASTDTKSQQPIEVPMITNARVLLVSEDVGSRFYPFWASRVIDVKDDASREVDMSLFSDPDALDKLVTDLCVGLLNVGGSLSNLNKSEVKHAFEEIMERYRDMLPHQNLLTEIAGCNDIISVREWLDAFQGPAHNTLESELVWPAVKPIII